MQTIPYLIISKNKKTTNINLINNIIGKKFKIRKKFIKKHEKMPDYLYFLNLYF
jgi:hypothetical protein